MNPVKLAGVVLIVAGVLGLVYGGFTYTKETHEAKIGSIDLSFKEKQTLLSTIKCRFIVIGKKIKIRLGLC